MPPFPALFVSHGAPTMAIEDTPTRRFLEGLGNTIDKPTAVVAVSSHWSAASPTIGNAPEPATLHDFHGFPEELYEINYPAKGDLELASRIQSLLKKNNIEATLDSKRGIDHAIWTPLRLMYPKADIPVVPLAVLPRQSGAFHFQLGEALRSLREDGVLILASGGITHNLMEYMVRGPEAPVEPWAATFADWVLDKSIHRDDQALMNWPQAPEALRNHPTPEHFLPFLTALGAGTPSLPARRLHQAYGWGVLALDAYVFD